MIIKSMARKAPTFGQLIAYIGRDAGDSPTISHNLYHSGENERLVEMQFRENHRKLPARKNGNALYHEIIAIEPQPHLSQEEIEKRLHWIAMLYMERRAPNQLAWGKVHNDTDFPHVHLMVSANSVQSSRRVRLSRKEFAEVQRKTEEAARHLYPELRLAPVYAKAHEKTGVAITKSEGEAIHRTGKPSRKQQVAKEVKRLMDQHADIGQLDIALGKVGFSLARRGSNYVLQEQATGRRYRMKTLGLGDDIERIAKTIKPKEPEQAPPQEPSKPQSKDPRIAELENLARQRLKSFEQTRDGEERDR